MIDINNYWQIILQQNAEGMRKFFHDEALIYWHNTNEQFTVDEFIKANCEYPGDWIGKIERVETIHNVIVCVVAVHSKDNTLNFHVVSFIETDGEKILSIDEYWGDDGQAPDWRLDMNLGNPIDKGSR